MTLLPKRTYNALLRIYNEFQQKILTQDKQSQIIRTLLRELRNLDKEIIHDLLVNVLMQSMRQMEGDLMLSELNGKSKKT